MQRSDEELKQVESERDRYWDALLRVEDLIARKVSDPTLNDELRRPVLDALFGARET